MRIDAREFVGSQMVPSFSLALLSGKAFPGKVSSIVFLQAYVKLMSLIVGW